jgi:hypothetical protein
MTAAERKDAETLIDMLKAKGVRTFKGFGIELELGPPVAEPMSEREMLKAFDDGVERCKGCKHEMAEHVQGICLHCPPEKCAGEQATSEKR